jgi:High potential iron-sulfur protein
MEDDGEAVLSRRDALRKFSLTVGGTAIATALASFDPAAADSPAKMAQQDVAYQQTPHQGQACATCANFESPAACKVVEGRINAAGWCQLYVKKT